MKLLLFGFKSNNSIFRFYLLQVVQMLAATAPKGSSETWKHAEVRILAKRKCHEDLNCVSLVQKVFEKTPSCAPSDEPDHFVARI